MPTKLFVTAVLLFTVWTIPQVTYGQHEETAIDKAIAELDEAIRLNSQNAKAYNDRGNAWFDKGDFDKAIADFDEAVRLDPQNIFFYNDRAIAWSEKGNYDKAIADLDKAVKLDPQHRLAYYNRGMAWSRKGDQDKAIADYNDAIRFDPQFAPAYSNLAWLMATCSDAEFRDGARAIEMAKKACELTDYQEAYILDTLAAAYAETGNFEEAIKWQQKALAIAPTQHEAQIRHHLELYRAGQPYRQD